MPRAGPKRPSRCPELTVGALRDALESRYGEAMQRVLRTGSILVDGVVSRDRERPLGAAADVLPRFSGG